MDSTEYYWRLVANPPRTMNHAFYRLIACIGQLFFVGGRAAEWFDTMVCFRVNVPSMTWTLLNLPRSDTNFYGPIRKRDFQLFSWNDKIGVFGGIGSDSSSVCFFDPCSRQWTKANQYGVPPDDTTRFASCVLDNKFFVFGGDSAFSYSNDLHCFNLHYGMVHYQHAKW